MIKIFLLLLASNIITLVAGILRANFVDTVNFSLGDLLDPRFWLKNPALVLIVVLCGLWFFLTTLAAQSASITSQTKLTASTYMGVSMTIGPVFTLINLAAYQTLRREMITPTMWIWASVATLCIIISSIAMSMFLNEGQKGITLD